MSEKETVFSSKIKSTGIFSFKDFYKFCYDWLKDETGMPFVREDKYTEKIEGTEKKIEVEWTGEKKITDYFRFDIKIKMKAEKLKEVEITQGGAKIKTNQGAVEVEIKGIIVRDYEGKFEMSAFKKFLRGVYEKWVVPAMVEEHKTKIAEDCDKFLNQAKAWLDLEGKKL